MLRLERPSLTLLNKFNHCSLGRQEKRPRHRSITAASYTITLVDPRGRESRLKSGSSSYSIYELASYADVHLPACCLQGSCSSCCGKIVHGKVDQHQQTCLPASLVKEGYVALCCAHALSDVTILTHQGPKVRAAKHAAEQLA